MKRSVIEIVAVMLMTMMVAMIAVNQIGRQDHATTVPDRASLPACLSDDGEGAPCYWDAQSQGDGKGTSFMALIDGEGEVYFITR